jgi:hypothetical protein
MADTELPDLTEASYPLGDDDWHYVVQGGNSRKAKHLQVKGALPLPTGYRSGFGLSNNASDATNDIDIALGAARGDADALDLRMAATCVKQIDVTFAEYSSIGTPSGGRASADNLTGAKWFRVFMIGGSGKNTQPFFATSATPTLPTGFTGKRLIGFIYWTGSAIRGFKQAGDIVELNETAADYNSSVGSGSRTLISLTSPPWEVEVKVQVSTNDTDGDNCFFSSPLTPDEVASVLTNAQITANTAGNRISQELPIVTNSSGQIGARGTGSISIRVNTRGWRYINL